MIVLYIEPVKYEEPKAALGLTYETSAPSVTAMSIGKKIQTLRLEHGLTLPALAEKAGMSKGFLFQVETDEKANPSLDTLNKIAKALDITLSVLLQKESVQAKKIVPEQIAPGLRQFLDELRGRGEPVDEGILQALYVLQERKGKTVKTKDDWRWLYESIRMGLGESKRK